TPLGARAHGEVAIYDHRPASDFAASGADAGVHVEFRHASGDVRTDPGVARVGRGHAGTQNGDFVGVFLSAQAGARVDHPRGVRRTGAVVDLQAVARWVDVAQRGELPWANARRLSVVPGHDDRFIDVGILY